MDVLTVIASGAVGALVTFLLMFFFYRFWILPYLTELTCSVPSSVKELVFPYVDGMKKEIMDEINNRIDDTLKTVKASSARFQRTVNQACASLDLDNVDLETEDGIEAAKSQISKRYGADVAIQAITQLIASMQAAKKPSELEKGVSIW